MCGERESLVYNGYNYSWIEMKLRRKKFVTQIPEDLLDDKTLLEDGMTYRMVREEIEKNKEYIKYLRSLKEELCKLFGHDGEMIDSNENFICRCCGKKMRYPEYIESHYSAKYRHIIKYYY